MNKRQAQRLLRVAKALRQSPNPRAFTMGCYVHECGTPACAFGHYAARRDLQRIVRVTKSNTFNDNPILVFGNNRDANYDNTRILDHFGITLEQANELFGVNGCGGARTTIAAAKYIEQFVRNHYGELSL